MPNIKSLNKNSNQNQCDKVTGVVLTKKANEKQQELLLDTDSHLQLLGYLALQV